MANGKQPDRWQSSLLAAAMAVAGTLFLFDKLGSLMRTGLFSFNTVLHASPIFLAVLGLSLWLAQPSVNTTASTGRHSKEGRYE
jgi:hypothetical protein